MVRWLVLDQLRPSPWMYEREGGTRLVRRKSESDPTWPYEHVQNVNVRTCQSLCWDRNSQRNRCFVVNPSPSTSRHQRSLRHLCRNTERELQIVLQYWLSNLIYGKPTWLHFVFIALYFHFEWLKEHKFRSPPFIINNKMIIAPYDFAASRQWAEDWYSFDCNSIFLPYISMRILLMNRANWISIAFTVLILLKHEPMSKIINNGIKILDIKPPSYSSRLSMLSCLLFQSFRGLQGDPACLGVGIVLVLPLPVRICLSLWESGSIGREAGHGEWNIESSSIKQANPGLRLLNFPVDL